jgi:L-asparaginase
VTSPVQVSVIALGGTIASVPGRDGAAPELSADQLVAAVPGLPDDVTIVAETFRMLPSPWLGFQDIVDLASRIRDEVAGGVAGVVVTQGTDTIEETAFALDLLLAGTTEPVVVTGAMRHPGLAGPDGPGNLLAAVAVASSEAARGLGVLVVLNDTVHAARYVRKTHTSSPSAFASRTLGPVGYVAEGEAVIPYRLDPLPALPGRVASPVPNRVLLTMVGLDDPGLWLPLAAGDAVDGVVVAALGGGHVPAQIADQLVEVAQSKPTVLASRVPAGPVLSSTYGIHGGEMDLLRRGLIHAGWLDATKARVLLTLLLATGCAEVVVRSTFQEFSQAHLAPQL